MTTTAPWLWIVGGPHGAGKTLLATGLFAHAVGTEAYIHIEDTVGLSLMDGAPPPEPPPLLLAWALAREKSFVTETAMTSRQALELGRELKKHHWRIGLVFVWLDDAAKAAERMARRTGAGGPESPPTAYRRAVSDSLVHLPSHLDLADRWIMLDNSGGPQRVIADGAGPAARIADADLFRRLVGEDYPAMTPPKGMLHDPWADRVQKAFRLLVRRRRPLENLLMVAAAAEMEQSDSPGWWRE